MQKIFGVGNPLLDISAEVSEELLTKYHLIRNGFSFLEEHHNGFYDELKNLNTCQYNAGGASLNSIRIYNGLAAATSDFNSDVASFSGCIGNDTAGQKLRELCEVEGVTTRMRVDDTQPTGICGVAVINDERSLVTSLGAANYHSLTFIENEAFPLLHDADVAYSSGYFLTVCASAVEKVGEYCAKENKMFATNLSAPFLVEHFKSQMMAVWPYADIIFGNEDEWGLFGKLHFDSDDLKTIAQKACSLFKANKNRGRIIVVTCGSDSTYIAYENDGVKLLEFPVIKLDLSEIKDTNAAGDAYAGGFLFGYANTGSIEGAIRFANYAACHIIQRSGCCFDFLDVPEL